VGIKKEPNIAASKAVVNPQAFMSVSSPRRNDANLMPAWSLRKISENTFICPCTGVGCLLHGVAPFGRVCYKTH